jgi:nitrous oxide reductase accessory protein NosL
MKYRIISFLTAVCFTLTWSAALAGDQHDHLQHKAAAEASKQEDIAKHHACQSCGMERKAFLSSRMLITYADGKTVATCSIFCVTTELKANKGKVTKSIQVGDYNTGKLIDAKKAFWVIGGDLSGVMAKTATWAFAEKGAAAAFIGKHGGKLAGYKEALKAGSEE